MSFYNNEIFAEVKRDTINHIGIFRALYLGDMLCIIPAVRAIRTAFPEAKITLIGLPWEKDFTQRFHYYFNTCIEFPGWPGLPEQPPKLHLIPAFISNMQEENFDLILQMQGNDAITNNMCMLWNAKKSLWFEKRK